MAEVIAFPVVSRSIGTGAREVLQSYFEFMEPGEIDHFLAWLYSQGFYVAPVPRDDDGAA